MQTSKSGRMTGLLQKDETRGARARLSGCLDFSTNENVRTYASLDLLTNENVWTPTPQTGGRGAAARRALRVFTHFLPVGNFAGESAILFLPVGKLRIFNLTLRQCIL
jgi:hypothetical protein